MKTLTLWRWLALPASQHVKRPQPARWQMMLAAAVVTALGMLTLVVPSVGVQILILMVWGCVMVLVLNGTLRGIFLSVDAATFIYRYTTNTSWETLQSTPEGALQGVLHVLRLRMSRSTTVAVQMLLWRLLVVLGGLVLLAAMGTQLVLGQDASTLWTLLALVIVIPVDSAQSIPLGILIGLISARVSSDAMGAALAAGLLYCAAKGFIFMLSASFVESLGIGSVALYLALQEALLWLVWHMLHSAYDAW